VFSRKVATGSEPMTPLLQGSDLFTRAGSLALIGSAEVEMLGTDGGLDAATASDAGKPATRSALRDFQIA
jgi:hypothetical protein